MRLRNIPGAADVIAESPICVKDPAALKGNWKKSYPFEGELNLEIGMGKGQFLTGLAAKNPTQLYLGFERYSSVLLRAVQKLDAMEEIPKNLLYCCCDAAQACDFFEPGEVDKIYLNFSDPWPKDRHARRRLTSPRFLDIYKVILSDSGVIEFKTDNRILFDYSVDVIKESPDWELVALTYDLHNDKEMVKGNIMTEYEEKFSSQGNPICKYIIKKKDN